MHAYMIIAHNQFALLERLIAALDDERNDIYIHIDKKVKDFDFEHFKSIAKRSSVYFTQRIKITWGDFSQVKAEMLLLEAAVKNENPNKPYTYYHLISGVDLPIKSNDEIHSFFDESNGKEFIHFTHNETADASVNRIKYYHLFRKKRNLFYKILAQAALRVQQMLHINRLKNKNISVQKGCNWFSITGAFAHFIADNMVEYEELFRLSYCADEVFIQTALLNSPFKDNLYMPNCNNNHLACARLIDWERGDPYIFKKEDYDLIKASPAMFARKFDLNTDSQIIDMILNRQ